MQQTLGCHGTSILLIFCRRPEERSGLGLFFCDFFFFFLLFTVKPCVPRRFWQWKQNKSCLVLKGCIVGESGEWTEGAQADRDGWWMPPCNRAHRDWRLFVATNGIVHIFHCNPRLRPRNWGVVSPGVTVYQSFHEHMDVEALRGVTQRRNSVSDRQTLLCNNITCPRVSQNSLPVIDAADTCFTDLQSP